MTKFGLHIGGKGMKIENDLLQLTKPSMINNKK